MKNKSFKNYYDEIQVDENLLQQIPIKKHHYYKPILIISCVVLLFVLGIQNKETKDTFEILAYNQTYNSITTQATPMDYYLIHDQVDIMDKVQLKKKYEEKYFSKKTDFKQSQLDLKNYDGKYYLDGYLTTSYFTVDVQSDEIESIRIVQGGNPLEIHLGGKVYQSDTTISYDLYKKYYHTKKGLKVIWKPEDYLFNSKIKDISDNFRIEVNYKSKASKLFEIELSFNQKGQMFVQKRKAKRTEINTELKQSKHKYLRFSTLSESETIKELKELSNTGTDNVKFLFSANKNAPLRDISEIASGGEVARVMLCLKAILSNVEGCSTIVFDEIDTGVSGRIAEQMACTMQEMSQGNRQVISITHLPQIAAYGKYHYHVYKTDEQDTTISKIELLSPEQRINEIAYMLSGKNITDAAVKNAKELLENRIVK